MKDKDYRRDWAQAAARKKLIELRGRWSDARIGREVGGVSGTYIAALLREDDPKPVSKKVWDALVQEHGLSPHPASPSEPMGSTDSVAPQKQDQLERLTRAVEEQGVLLRTLTELIIARLGKEALKG